jgi:tRNA A-37 threonylcarbamoyl transferase component Bud32
VEYTVLHTAAGTVYAAASLSPTLLAEILQQPDALLWQYIDRPVKLSHESLLVEAELPTADGPIRVAYKKYRPRGWWKSVCDWLRPSRARRGWSLAHALLARQIDTPRPLAVFEPRDGWFFRSSCLATEWVADSENLHLYGWRLAGYPMPKRLRAASRCAVSLGRLIGRMHAAHVCHRDLKAANLLAVERQGDVAVYLVDVDGARIGRSPSSRRRAADLARLAAALEAHSWVTPSICCRFLRAYAAEFPPGAIVWKSLWRDVARRTKSYVQRKRGRGEQVL